MLNSEKNFTEQLNATTEQLLKTLSGKGTQTQVKMMDNVISFVGMSGGNGTSFLVSNIGHIMAKKYGLNVLIIDTNILYPEQYVYFKFKIAREKNDLVSFLLGKNEVGESIETRDKLSVLYSSNRHLLDSINCDTELAAGNFSELINRIKYLFDVILIDCPNDLRHDLVNMALFKSDSIYTVWGESLSCIANADRFRYNLSVTGIDGTRIKAIMNKRTSVYYAESTFKDLGYSLVEVIPFELSVIECDLQGGLYYKDGISSDKNAQIVINRLERLTEKVLRNGGYNINRKDKDSDTTGGE